MSWIKSKRERQWIKRLKELDETIVDNTAHILGHKEVIDKAKAEKIRIFAEIEAYKAAK